jgi:hypothetical protein
VTGEAGPARDYTYVCNARTSRNVRDALTGCSRVAFLTLFSVLILVGLLIAVGDGIVASLPILGGAVVGLICMLRATSAKRWAGTLGAGTDLRSSFGPDAVTVSGLLTSSTTPYTSFTQLEVRGRMTMWKMRRARMKCLVPVEIFPPAEVARVEAASAPA